MLSCTQFAFNTCDREQGFLQALRGGHVAELPTTPPCVRSIGELQVQPGFYLKLVGVGLCSLS